MKHSKAYIFYKKKKPLNFLENEKGMVLRRLGGRFEEGQRKKETQSCSESKRVKEVRKGRKSFRKRWSDHDGEYLGGEWRGDFRDLRLTEREIFGLESLTFEE